ncbi:hypothetical protein Dimus_037482, partial [Dionaea muscipula]
NAWAWASLVAPVVDWASWAASPSWAAYTSSWAAVHHGLLHAGFVVALTEAAELDNAAARLR